MTLLLTALASTAALRITTTRRQVVTGVALAVSPALPASAQTMSGAERRDDKMDATRKAVTTPEAAKAQLADGYKALGELLDNYDKVTEEGGGDGIRRVLGTVGTTSPVYLIEPAFRLLFEKDESLPMEYIEGVESIMLGLQLADSEAYSANFVRWRRLEPRAFLQHRFLGRAPPVCACVHTDHLLIGQGQARGLFQAREGTNRQGEGEVARADGAGGSEAVRG